MLDEAFALLREITARGRRAVIVGGAVRDLLLELPVTDVDIATDMPLQELAALFTTYGVGRSKEFDTVVVTRGGHAFEITRFRGGVPGRPPTAETAAPRESFDPLREDTAHRDFTINALLMGPDGRVVDFQGGREDLDRRVIRAVGSPRERFAEDPARVLRAVRFAACLGFTIEENTAAAIRAAAPLLAGVAGERIGKELLKIASRPGPALADGVELLERFGMLELLLPEVRGLKGLPHPAEWHPEGDAWEHTLAALRASRSADPAVNLAALLHDVGKRPAHREVDGRHRYHGHEAAAGGLVEAVARRLFLPHRLRAAIGFAVEHHLQAGRFDELRRSKSLALLASEHWPVLRAVALCDRAARGDAAAATRLEDAFRRGEADATAAAVGEARGGAPALSGTRVMELTGLPPGPRIGEIRRRVREWAQDNRVEEPALIEAQILREAAALDQGAP